MTIYADHAATTPMDARLAPALADALAAPLNPSSVHAPGQQARRRLDDCRERAAAVLGVASPDDVVFTSGATESANLALRGFAALFNRPVRIVASPIEHSCVRDTIEALAKNGAAEIVDLPVDESGCVRLPEKEPDGADILCLMAVNNETGVVQDIEGARRLRESPGRMTWLCDAAQAVGKIDVNAAEWRADWIFASGHKIGGPPGVGLLAGPGVRRIASQITGGPQEHELRAGTQAVALVEAFVAALEFAKEERAARCDHLRAVEDELLNALREANVAFRISGDEPRAAGLLNLSFPGLEAMDVVIALDQRGVAVSPGSACSTGVVAVSPVLAAMYPNDPERAAGGVRLSFGRSSTPEEARLIGRELAAICKRSKAGGSAS